MKELVHTKYQVALFVNYSNICEKRLLTEEATFYIGLYA